jgi:hypothetical protein
VNDFKQTAQQFVPLLAAVVVDQPHDRWLKSRTMAAVHKRKRSCNLNIWNDIAETSANAPHLIIA